MTGKVAIVTGASRGIGAGLIADYRRQGWAVVTSARTIAPSEDPGVLTVTGDNADAEIADRIIGGALRQLGRIDTLTVRADKNSWAPISVLVWPSRASRAMEASCAVSVPGARTVRLCTVSPVARLRHT
jgi:NAD(P)-dependent dehydrogenase (short-subunit alcohol dehydrogenase family)